MEAIFFDKVPDHSPFIQNGELHKSASLDTYSSQYRFFHILYEQANTLYQTDIHTAPTTNKPGTASLSTRGIDIDHELQVIVKMTAQVHMKRWQWPKTPFEHECVW